MKQQRGADAGCGTKLVLVDDRKRLHGQKASRPGIASKPPGETPLSQHLRDLSAPGSWERCRVPSAGAGQRRLAVAASAPEGRQPMAILLPVHTGMVRHSDNTTAGPDRAGDEPTMPAWPPPAAWRHALQGSAR